VSSDFLPPDDPIISADDDLDASLTILDEIVASDLVAADPPPPIGKSYYFDFALKRFTRAGADSPMVTNGLDTLNQWVEKTIRTAKGAHPVYPSDYGMEDPWSIYGKHPNSADYATLEANIREALTFHPRIVDIDHFAADMDPVDEVVLVTFHYILDDGTRQVVGNLPVG
jgi:hypothetical protein